MQSSTQTRKYAQGCIVWASYPLTDKIDKLKWRFVLVISNSATNSLDNDYIVLPITKAIREEVFSLTIFPDEVDGDLPIQSEVRCNKPFTIRNVLVHELIGVLSKEKVHQATLLAQTAISSDAASL